MASELELALLAQMRQLGLPEPECEYRFAALAVGTDPGLRKRLAAAGLRDWRFDFAWPWLRLAVEVEGGTWTRGRHVRGGGFENDCRKSNNAVLRGWRVLRFTGAMIESGEALATVERMMNQASR